MANIIVTGAGRGIGLELVRYYNKNGHQVVAVSRNLSQLINEPLDGVFLYPGDLTTMDTDDLIRFSIQQMGTIDVLINNAGAIVNKPFVEIRSEEVEAVYQVNVFSVIKLTQSLIKTVGEHGKVHTINIGSMGGFQGSAKFPGLSVYSSSKGAVSILTECLAEEFKDTGYKFNSLCLGAVQTEMLSAAFPGYVAPLTPVEMAQYIGGFALTGWQYMNGKVLPVSVSTP